MIAARKRSNVWIYAVVAAVLVVLLAAFAYYVVQRVNGTLNEVANRTDRQSSVALHFSQALHRQDFALAFADLAPNATVDGKVMDQAAFATLAKDVDSREGYVLYYGLLRDQGDPNRYTVTLTRANKTERLQVQFQQVAGAWKIASIDGL